MKTNKLLKILSMPEVSLWVFSFMLFAFYVKWTTKKRLVEMATIRISREVL